MIFPILPHTFPYFPMIFPYFRMVSRGFSMQSPRLTPRNPRIFEHIADYQRDRQRRGDTRQLELRVQDAGGKKGDFTQKKWGISWENV